MLNKLMRISLPAVLLNLLACGVAFAGDGATILFREGQLAYISNGYSQIAEAYKRLNKESSPHNIVELKLESNPFFINLSEIVVICRDRCTSLELVDPRRSSASKSQVTVNQP